MIPSSLNYEREREREGGFLTGNMLGSGWTIGRGAERDLCVGSGVGFVEMEKFKLGAAGSVWGAEEAFLSPPEYRGSLGASCESEGSSEDCEDYISGLAEEIAQSMLQEEEEAPKKSAPRGVGLLAKPAWSSGHQMASSPTSPQSTLAGMGGYNWEGNTGSSGVSSPPTPREGEPRDVLYAELLRLKLEDQVKLASQQQMLSPQQQIIQRPTPAAKSPSDDALPLDRFSGVKAGKYARSKGGGRQEPEIHYFRGGSKAQGGGAGPWGCGAMGGQPPPSPPTASNNRGGGGEGVISTKKRREEQQYHQFSLFASNMEVVEEQQKGWMMMTTRRQQQEEGGMRAVFLGARDQCGGTGVFLPRRLGSSHDSWRKPACSTVLLPSRIVNALNLNIEDTLSSPHHRTDFPSSNPHWRQNPPLVGSRRTKPKDEVPACYFPTDSHPTTLQEVAPDINLPSEWTY